MFNHMGKKIIYIFQEISQLSSSIQIFLSVQMKFLHPTPSAYK